ncbi:MAG: YaiO family outer membrane beta-barrel protein [Longimicrobiales bacterium]
MALPASPNPIRRPSRRACPAVLAALTFLVGSPLAGLQDADGEATSTDTVRVSASVEHTRFSGSVDPWTSGSVGLSASTRPGSLTARLNAARRFDRTGRQFELDAYPDLGPGRYAYLNIGWSSASIYPHHRYGAELYSGLPGPWEASLGMRHLRFRSSNVTLYTGSLGVYRGNWWYSLRPFVKPDDGDVGVSMSLIGRKYGRDRYDYWGFRIGVGASAADIDTDFDLGRDNSVTLSLNGRVPVGDGPWNLSWGGTWEWEELSGDRSRQRFEVDLGFSVVVAG